MIFCIRRDPPPYSTKSKKNSFFMPPLMRIFRKIPFFSEGIFLEIKHVLAPQDHLGMQKNLVDKHGEKMGFDQRIFPTFIRFLRRP